MPYCAGFQTCQAEFMERSAGFKRAAGRFSSNREMLQILKRVQDALDRVDVIDMEVMKLMPPSDLYPHYCNVPSEEQ